MAEEEEDDDFAQLFADFNIDDENIKPEDCDFIDQISSNLREAAGLSEGAAVHAGDVDEGKITWVAPERSGIENLANSGPAPERPDRRNDASGPSAPQPAAPAAPAPMRRPAADSQAKRDNVAKETEEMWDRDEMQPSPKNLRNTSSIYVSDNLIADLKAIEEQAAGTAKSMVPEEAKRAIDALQTLKRALPTFKDALNQAAAELTTSEEGRTLLQCFLSRKQVRRREREANEQGATHPLALWSPEQRATPCSPGALTLTIIVPPPLLVREQVEKKRRKSKEQ